MVSSYGLITQLYLPLMLDGLLFFCPERSKNQLAYEFLTTYAVTKWNDNF